MQVNVSGMRRNFKNLAHNYSDAQVKVREATSNDPWGPSTTIMSEIADLTYNVVAFSEIMTMVWKRLNDHGRNWRHVYKALVLLEYLIKTGSEKVAQQCRENIFAIQTLKDFQHIEENKDQGTNVREKSKQLVNLLKDDERLKNERAKAIKARERFAQATSGFGSDSHESTPSSPTFPGYPGYENDSLGKALTNRDVPLPVEVECARPQTAGEEELQLQLALAMSREEAEQEEQRRRSDDVRLQMALSQSQDDYRRNSISSSSKPQTDHLMDLLDVNLGGASSPPPVSLVNMPSSQSAPSINADPWGVPQTINAPRPQNDPWMSPSITSKVAAPVNADPWSPVIGQIAPPQKADPWTPPSQKMTPTPIKTNADPWSPMSGGLSSPNDMDEFDIISNRDKLTNHNINNNGTSSPFELGCLLDTMSDSDSEQKMRKKTPEAFLGENSSLVNLDNLVVAKPPEVAGGNPFTMTNPGQVNLFQQPPPQRPTINQMRQQPFGQPTTLTSAPPLNPSPISFTPLQPIPAHTSPTQNPFLT